MNPNFFQSCDQQLFGMYHRARGNDQTQKRAVVICSPIGQEYVRTHWCLRLLAGQLARRGIHVLRFDFAGIGDSSGSIDEVGSTRDWEENICSAIRFLKEQSAATSVMLLGLRAGATLATHVAERSHDVNSLLLWEPVTDGADYLFGLRQLHAEMLDLWICKMDTENGIAAEEILGARYSRSLVEELEQTIIDWENIAQPHFVFDTPNQRSRYVAVNNPMRKIEFVDDESTWQDLKQLETAWLRPQTTRKIVDQVVDTFDRLQRFGVLGSKVGVTAK